MSAKIACIIGNRMLSPIEVCLKRGQKTKYMWICFSTKERYVYLHPYCQRQIALHSFWVTTDPICSIWHSSPKCSGTLVGWSWHEFYRDECLYHTDKDSGRWSGYRPQRHELENRLKKWQQPMHSQCKLLYKYCPIGLSFETIWVMHRHHTLFIAKEGEFIQLITPW